MADDFTLPARPIDSHKGVNGRILIVAGSEQYRGAAVLTALGALRSGAGYVTVAAIPSVIENVSHWIPEVTYLPLDSDSGVIADSAADFLIERAGIYDAAVFGPGLTTSTSVKSLLADLWREWTIPSVIDADALNLVAQGLTLPKSPCVLTPHPGEAARILRITAQEIQEDRELKVQELQSLTQKTILLKGHQTLVCSEVGQVTANSTGNPGMATAGMGDVLSGIIVTLLAQLKEPHKAAVIGAHLHGLAGDIAAKEIGQIGYSASELAQFLPRARSMLTQ